jgi:filamentous hemagglutinin family protein
MKAPILPLLGAAALAAAVAVRAQLPSGAQVVHGDVEIAQSGSTMTLTQASRAAVVNWQSFSVGADAALRVRQAGPEAAMLARVTGRDPSRLLGSIQADGRLFLLNPRGILVGEGAVIDTAAFGASTLDVSDEDFLRGAGLTFKGESAAGVVNLGRIVAREGNVLLLAHTVRNAGAVEAPRGTAGLAAGTEVYLASADAPVFVVRSNLPAAAAGSGTGVENTGLVAAAQAQLEAAGGSLYGLAVNQAGVVRATGSAVRDGRVLLTAAGGTVGVSGEVAARNADGSGGAILVGGDYRGANAAVANAARTVVTSTGRLDAAAAAPEARAGRVVVWADDATRFLGTLRAAGAGGGFAEVSGRRWLDFDPAAAVQLGAGGTLLLDPDALVVGASANSGTSTSGTDPFTFGAATQPATLNIATLQNQLAVANVILDTSTATGDVTFNSAVTWTSGNSLTVRSGNNIKVNASIDGGASGALALYAGRKATAPGESGLPDIMGDATLESGATIRVGTLTFGANAQSAPPTGYVAESPGQAGNLTLRGNIEVGTLTLDLAGGTVGVSAEGTNNAIGTFSTTGTGALGSVFVADHQGGLDVLLNSTNAGGPALTFTTPGQLTLRSGSSLDFAEPGTVVLASTAGAFVNQAGASVFGANVRHLVYSSSPGATTKGGLGGTDVFNRAYSASDDFSGDTISRFLFSSAAALPVLTYAANNASRTYGAANPAFTFARTGLQSGVADDVTGAPTLATTATSGSGVGTYTISIARGTLASSNYDFAFTPGTLTVARAPLTITANDASRVFGAANPAFSASFSGLVNGDSPALVGGLTLGTAATAASPVGAYAITASGATAANYAISFAPGTLTVGQGLLTFTAGDAARTYGAANPAFSFGVSGFAGGDTAATAFTGAPVLSTTATQASGVGTYAINILRGTLASANYGFAFVPGTLTVSRAPLTAVVAPASRVFGAANPAFSFGSFLGLVNGDTPAVLSGISFATAAVPSSVPGTYPITGTATAANYAVTVFPGPLTVTRAPFFVTVPDVTGTIGTVAAGYPVLGVPAPVPGGPQFTVAATARATNASPAGTYALTPVVARTDGLPVSLLDLFYDIRLTPGTLTLRNPPTPSVLTSLNPVVLSGPTPVLPGTGPNQINTNVVLTPSQTVTVTRAPAQLTLGTVSTETAPMGPENFAAYFLGFGGEGAAVRTGMRQNYNLFLEGRGQSGSPYERMSPEARGLLAAFMAGALTVDALSARIAAGDQAAIAAFGFIMPTLIERTRDKPLDQLTSVDRMVLGRLADLTERRRTDTIRLAQKRYEDMVKSNAERAKLNGLATVFIGPGDFRKIVEGAREEAVGNYVGAVLGAGVGATATAGVLMALPGAAAAIFPHAAKAAAIAAAGLAPTGTSAASAGSVLAGSAAGPVTAAALMVVLAVRAVQISDSVKNEQEFNALMRSWTPGTDITSITALQSPGMDEDMKLSALMLSVELLKSGRP